MDLLMVLILYVIGGFAAGFLGFRYGFKKGFEHCLMYRVEMQLVKAVKDEASKEKDNDA